MRHVRKIETAPLSAGLWSCACAEQEARQLAGLLGKNRDTVESFRELIAVSPRVEALLRAFAQQHPESERGIKKNAGLSAPRR